VLSEHTDEDGATVFRQACKMDLDGIVSKRLCEKLQLRIGTQTKNRTDINHSTHRPRPLNPLEIRGAQPQVPTGSAMI
jgi:hypothetical protein